MKQLLTGMKEKMVMRFEILSEKEAEFLMRHKTLVGTRMLFNSCSKLAPNPQSMSKLSLALTLGNNANPEQHSRTPAPKVR